MPLRIVCSIGKSPKSTIRMTYRQETLEVLETDKV
jgi:hypothetical protein